MLIKKQNKTKHKQTNQNQAPLTLKELCLGSPEGKWKDSWSYMQGLQPWYWKETSKHALW